MLAGLIFATEDADDRPGVLAATLPFGGLTLVEFQARLLVGAGASQIILVVARMTPELLGAITRIGRRGVTVDAVRTAAEVQEKLHPLAQLLVVADGLVTTGEIVTDLAAEDGDALLVIDDRDAPPGFERVGALTAWAGLARLDSRLIAEVAALPKDYNFQSTLLRVAAQSGAEHIRLPITGSAHGVVRDSRELADRGKAILSALVAAPVRWADRWLLAPVARVILPALIGRFIPTVAVGATALLVAIAGIALIHVGWSTIGMVLTLLGVIGFSVGAILAWVRDEDGLVRWQRGALLATAGLATLLLGALIHDTTGSTAGLIAAAAAVVAAGLVERAAAATPTRRWWASPAAYPLIMLPLVAAGQPLVALGAAAIYAALTLAAAIEGFREKP